MHGGGHERGMRSGTLPTHQIVGMGEAYRIAKAEMAQDNAKARALHDRMLAGLKDIEQVFINGNLEQRVPHNLNMSFNYRRGRVADHGHQGPGGFAAARPAPRPGWSPATCCAPWAAATNWRTAACA